MEKTEKVNPNEKSDERVKNDTWGGSCPWWIFGDEKSADNDLKGKFEVVEDEPKD